MFNLSKSAGLAAMLSLILSSTLMAQSVTYSLEKPGIVNTTQENVITQSFSGFEKGKYSDLKLSIGTVSSTGLFAIVPQDQYGGAKEGGNYFTFGAQSGSAAPVTLTLNSPSNFFGMWWSAADLKNTISFYNNNELLNSFDTATLFKGVPSDYFGNPVYYHANRSEQYAYINFFATKGLYFNAVVLSNSGTTGTGFESDNWSIPAEGVSTPEPGTYLMLGSFILAQLLYFSFRQKRA